MDHAGAVREVGSGQAILDRLVLLGGKQRPGDRRGGLLRGKRRQGFGLPGIGCRISNLRGMVGRVSFEARGGNRRHGLG